MDAYEWRPLSNSGIGSAADAAEDTPADDGAQCD